MSVSKRKRRRIVVDEEKYSWEILPGEDEYDLCLWLQILSPDKSFLVQYPYIHETHDEFLRLAQEMAGTNDG